MAADGTLLVVFASLWFGAANLLVKWLGPGVPVAWSAFARSALALPLIWLLMRRRGLPVRSPNVVRLVLRGVWGASAMACQFWALPRMPIANAILLSHAAPLYAALWGTLFMGERLDRLALACVALAGAGIYVTWTPATDVEAGPYVAALSAGVFASLAFVTIRSLAREEPPLRILFYFAAVGTAALLPGVLASGYRPGAGEWAAMGGIALTATVGQLFLTLGLARAPVSRASLGALFIIVVNMLGGWALFGERPTARVLAGCALVSLGVAGLTGGFRRRLLDTLAD